jgi:hypothetical protein
MTNRNRSRLNQKCWPLNKFCSGANIFGSTGYEKYRTIHEKYQRPNQTGSAIHEKYSGAYEKYYPAHRMGTLVFS